MRISEFQKENHRKKLFQKLIHQNIVDKCLNKKIPQTSNRRSKILNFNPSLMTYKIYIISGEVKFTLQGISYCYFYRPDYAENSLDLKAKFSLPRQRMSISFILILQEFLFYNKARGKRRIYQISI